MFQSTICSILSNEKYKGDALMQKGFTKDFLTHKRVKNKGMKFVFKNGMEVKE